MFMLQLELEAIKIIKTTPFSVTNLKKWLLSQNSGGICANRLNVHKCPETAVFVQI
jgi:hypothetical protein